MNFQYVHLKRNPQAGWRIEAEQNGEWLTHLNREGEAIIFLEKINAENYIEQVIAGEIETRLIHVTF